MKKKIAAFALSMLCLLMAAGCGQKPAGENVDKAEIVPSAETETTPEAVADDYLTTISGTYVELFPELSKAEYRTIWIKRIASCIIASSSPQTETEPSSVISIFTPVRSINVLIVLPR